MFFAIFYVIIYSLFLQIWFKNQTFKKISDILQSGTKREAMKIDNEALLLAGLITAVPCWGITFVSSNLINGLQNTHFQWIMLVTFTPIQNKMLLCSHTIKRSEQIHDEYTTTIMSNSIQQKNFTFHQKTGKKLLLSRLRAGFWILTGWSSSC